MDNIKNIENVNRWRQSKGNIIRQKKYHYLRDLKINSREADKLKYQSIRNIVKFLYKFDYIDDTIKCSNELYNLING